MEGEGKNHFGISQLLRSEFCPESSGFSAPSADKNFVCPSRILIVGSDYCFVKVSSSYHLCVECFSQLSFDSEMYTKSAADANFVYTSESNESCEKHSTQR